MNWNDKARDFRRARNRRLQLPLLLWWCTSCLSLILATQLFGRDVHVASIPALQSVLANASPGDKIVVADGDYLTSSPLIIARTGTKLQPIEVAAQTIGGVKIEGVAGFTFNRPAAYVILRGFRFDHDAGTVKLPEGTHHCRVTRNVFELK